MRLGLALLFTLSVCACSRDPGPAPAVGDSTPAVQTARPGVPDSVAAVAQGGAPGPVTLRFVLEGRPVVGSASNLRLEFAATTALSGVSVRVSGEQLGLDAAGSSRVIDLPVGETIAHSVTFTPRATGIAEAAVHILPPGEGAVESVYAIPVLVDAAAN